jgi:hypothetical protein
MLVQLKAGKPELHHHNPRPSVPNRRVGVQIVAGYYLNKKKWPKQSQTVRKNKTQHQRQWGTSKTYDWVVDLQTGESRSSAVSKGKVGFRSILKGSGPATMVSRLVEVKVAKQCKIRLFILSLHLNGIKLHPQNHHWTMLQICFYIGTNQRGTYSYEGSSILNSETLDEQQHLARNTLSCRPVLKEWINLSPLKQNKLLIVNSPADLISDTNLFSSSSMAIG